MIDEIAQVGDKVVINIPDENWQWGYRPVEKQNGTPAEVIGFSEITYGRLGSFGLKPGVYVNRAWTKLRLEDGKEHTEFTGRLELANQEEYQRRVAEWRKKGTGRGHEFLRELPETKFWEGDNVLVYEGSRVASISAPDISMEDFEAIQDGRKPQNLLMVLGIEWGWKRNGEPWTYRVSDNFGAGWHTYAKEPNMGLVERGNVWKYMHGEQPQFKDLMDEANFFKMLGHTEEVRNPENNLYSWTKDEVLAAVKEGTVDAISLSNKLFGFGEKRIDAIRFKDRDLGEKVRTTTLSGFGVK